MTTPSERARAIVTDAVRALAAGGPPNELRAELSGGKALGFVPRQPRLEVQGEAWRLGILLIDPAARLYRVGDIIVSEPERQQGYVSELARARAELKAAARRGKIAPGRVVNLGARELNLSGDNLPAPLEWRDGEVWLEWASGSWMPLEAYVADRIALR